MAGKTIRVLIADDIEAHRRRFSRLIGSQPDMELVGQAQSGYEVVLLAAIKKPDVILMDIEMENKVAGITAAQEILRQFKDAKIIMLTVHEDETTIFEAFSFAITDYIVKTSSSEEILAGIRNAYQGTSPIRSNIAEKMRREFVRVKRSEASLLLTLSALSKLTASELAILKLFCQGYSKRQIAQMRTVEYDTIKKQTTNILKKFEAERMSDITHVLNQIDLWKYLT